MPATAWPETARWAGGLDPNDVVACAAARGVPVGPELGHDGALGSYDPDETYMLLTGTLDDERQSAEPGSALHRLATYAFQRRDIWDEQETREYWLAHLSLWPAREGSPSNREAKAFAYASALGLGLNPDEAAEALHLSKKTVANAGLPSSVESVREELGRPHGALVPRVLTIDEYYARDRPAFGWHQCLAATEQHAVAPTNGSAAALLSAAKARVAGHVTN